MITQRSTCATKGVPAPRVIAAAIDRQDEDDGGDQEGADQQRAEKRQIAEATQAAGDGEIEGDEQQEIRPRCVDALSVVLERAQDPGNADAED